MRGQNCDAPERHDNQEEAEENLECGLFLAGNGSPPGRECLMLCHIPIVPNGPGSLNQAGLNVSATPLLQ